jgi:hypothetical protein
MKEYSFEVRLRAVVRVRASSKEEASKVVGSVLGAPSNLEIGLVNENNAALGRTATITAVDYEFTGEPNLVQSSRRAT